MSEALARTVLDPETPEHWIDGGFEPLFAMSWRDCEDAQAAALRKRFGRLL